MYTCHLELCGLSDSCTMRELFIVTCSQVLSQFDWVRRDFCEGGLGGKKGLSEKDFDKCPLKGIAELIKNIHKSDGFKTPPNYDSINMTLLGMLDKKDNKLETVKTDHCLFGFEHAAQVAYRQGMERSDGRKICEGAVERDNMLKGKNDIFLVGKKKDGK